MGKEGYIMLWYTNSCHSRGCTARFEQPGTSCCVCSPWRWDRATRDVNSDVSEVVDWDRPWESESLDGGTPLVMENDAILAMEEGRLLRTLCRCWIRFA